MIRLSVTRTAEAVDEIHLQPLSNGPKAICDLKRRIWKHFWVSTARAENALLPVSRLPAEVFLLCVDHYLAISRIDQMSDMKTYRRLQALSSVCWSWKCTIDHTPALWSSLPRNKGEEHAELCLSRSGNHPLYIDFYLSGSSLQKFSKRVLPYLGRCSTFGLYFGRPLTEDVVENVFDHFKRTQMSLLENLRVSCAYFHIPTLDVFAVHPESFLKRVDLQFWRTLSFATPPPPTLRHLSMGGICRSDQIRLDPSHFFRVLNQLPALEHLEIYSVGFQPLANTTLEPLALRNLRHLRLEQKIPFTLDFLRQAVLPSLQTFHGGIRLYRDSPGLEELKTLITPLIHKVLQTLPRSSSLRLEVLSASTFRVKICDDNEDYMKTFVSLNSATDPAVCLQWLNRFLQDAACPLPLYITFHDFPHDFSDQSLLDALIHLPHVRSITFKEYSDVNPVVRSLISESPQICPLPELTHLVFDSVTGLIDSGICQWVHKSRPSNVPRIKFLFNNDTADARLEQQRLLRQVSRRRGEE